MCTKVIDSGASYFITSHRVQSDHRGQGFMGQLSAYADNHMKTILCAPRIYSKMSCWSSEENMRKLERHPEREIIDTKVNRIKTNENF